MIVLYLYILLYIPITQHIYVNVTMFYKGITGQGDTYMHDLCLVNAHISFLYSHTQQGWCTHGTYIAEKNNLTNDRRHHANVHSG